MKVLVYTSSAISSNWSESARQQLSILKDIGVNSVDILSVQKTDLHISHFERECGLKINRVDYYREDYYDNVTNLENWEEAYKHCDVSHLEEYDLIVVTGGMLSEGAAAQRGMKLDGVFPVGCSGQIKYLSIGVRFYHMLAICKANKEAGIKVYEIAHDPLELSLDIWHPNYRPTENYKLFHGYDDPEYNLHRLDSLQYYLKNRALKFDTEKKVDFVFGYTIKIKAREWVRDEVERIASLFDSKEIYVDDKFKKINTSVSRNDYLYKVARAKYTLIIPSYCPRSMSNYRVVESLWYECLPLFHEKCNIKLLEDSFGVDLSRLVVTEDWKPFTDSERIDTVNYLKSKFCVTERLL